MSLFENDHITKAFNKLVDRITQMICFDKSRNEIAEILFSEGFSPNEIKLAFYAACIKFEDLGNSPYEIK